MNKVYTMTVHVLIWGEGFQGSRSYDLDWNPNSMNRDDSIRVAKENINAGFTGSSFEEYLTK